MKPSREPIIPTSRGRVYVTAEVVVKFDVATEEDAVTELVNRLAGTKLASSLHSIHIRKIRRET